MKILQVLTLILFFLIGIEATAQINTEKQMQKFQLIDLDENEVITIREMIAFCEGKTNEQGEPIDAKVIFYGLDLNEDTIVTVNEFIKGIDWKIGKKRVEAYTKKWTPDNEELPSNIDPNIKKKEDKFFKEDYNNDGYISLQEMINFDEGKKNKKGEPFESELMFYGLDRNQDNKLSLEEFIQKVDWNAGKLRLNDNKTQKPKTTLSRAKVDKFVKIDTDIDNELSLQELIDFNKGKTNKKGEPINGSIIFYGLDSNEDGRVSLPEFNERINWKLGKKMFKESDKLMNSYKAVDSYHVPTPSGDYVNDQITNFYKVDVDKNYKLSLEELLNFYKGKTNKNGKPINGEVMYYGLDTNNDGSLELEEFTKKVNLIKAINKIKDKRS